MRFEIPSFTASVRLLSRPSLAPSTVALWFALIMRAMKLQQRAAASREIARQFPVITKERLRTKRVCLSTEQVISNDRARAIRYQQDNVSGALGSENLTFVH